MLDTETRPFEVDALATARPAMAPPRARSRALAVAIALLAVAIAASLAHTGSTIGLHVPFNRNEGWNAYYADSALAGGTLYPQPPSLVVNNYPPLYFYLDGAAGRAIGDDIVAGRILSMLAFVALGIGVAAVVRRMGGRVAEASFAALFFGACVLLESDYVGMNDPQLVGQALDVGAIAVALRAPRTNRRLVAAAALLALAFSPSTT